MLRTTVTSSASHFCIGELSTAPCRRDCRMLRGSRRRRHDVDRSMRRPVPITTLKRLRMTVTFVSR